jgi:pilus assembly protein CpaC
MKSDRIRRRQNIAICVSAALLAIAPASTVRAADGDDFARMGAMSDATAQPLQMGVGQSVIRDLPEEAGEIYVGDPNVANAIVRTAKRIYISGVANGHTSIFALAKDGRRIAFFQVSVGRAIGELTALLNVAVPGNEIRVRTVENTIILTGSVASAEEAQKALDIASGFVNDSPTSTSGAGPQISISSGSSGGGAPGGKSSSSPQGKVVNALTIRGADQVSLRVTIAEIRRDIVKQLGVNLSGAGPNGSFTLAPPFAINGAVATSEATLNWFKGSGSLSANLQAFERQGVAHTLAEPTVTAVSGETAKFLAGGTIPILNSENCNNNNNTGCQYGFIQQPYGVTLNFTPVVLSQGRIQLRIATEVTDIDYSKQVTFSGISVPGFRTRSNTTTVELPSGGSIASAGLISTQTEQAINGLPALMNLPVLGALFRSRDYQRSETELLVVVTPFIAHAIDPSQVVRPDQNFQDASDPQTWFLGRVNRIYSTSQSLQPMPGYAGKIGFITQ